MEFKKINEEMQDVLEEKMTLFLEFIKTSKNNGQREYAISQLRDLLEVYRDTLFSEDDPR